MPFGTSAFGTNPGSGIHESQYASSQFTPQVQIPQVQIPQVQIPQAYVPHQTFAKNPIQTTISNPFQQRTMPRLTSVAQHHIGYSNQNSHFQHLTPSAPLNAPSNIPFNERDDQQWNEKLAQAEALAARVAMQDELAAAEQLSDREGHDRVRRQRMRMMMSHIQRVPSHMGGPTRTNTRTNRKVEYPHITHREIFPSQNRHTQRLQKQPRFYTRTDTRNAQDRQERQRTPRDGTGSDESGSGHQTIVLKIEYGNKTTPGGTDHTHNEGRNGGYEHDLVTHTHEESANKNVNFLSSHSRREARLTPVQSREKTSTDPHHTQWGSPAEQRQITAESGGSRLVNAVKDRHSITIIKIPYES